MLLLVCLRLFFYKLKEASDVRLYPYNTEIAAEKMLYLETDSKQKKLNIYSSITVEIGLFTQLRRYPGIVKIFLHKKCDIALN